MLDIYFRLLLHIALGSQILSSDITDNRIKGAIPGASEEYVRMAKSKEIYNPFKLFVPLRDHFLYISRAQALMPRKDPQKVGSNPLGWPIGINNINYTKIAAVGSNKIGYLDFRGNPVNWALGLTAVLFSICLVFVKNVFKAKVSNARIYNYIFIFVSLYLGYMSFVTVVAATRIMYIHLYLFPLFLSFVLFFLMFNYIFEKYIIKKDIVLNISVFLLVAQSFFVYTYTSPTTYGKSINYLECEKLRLVDYWKDDCSR
jgi:dolichyl-phosphate-mannose--protein O-mannosyl transferase